jgi:hypothetical protein
MDSINECIMLRLRLVLAVKKHYISLKSTHSPDILPYHNQRASETPFIVNIPQRKVMLI